MIGYTATIVIVISMENIVTIFKYRQQGKATLHAIRTIGAKFVVKQLIKKMHKKEHQCGEVYCKTCKDFYEVGHLCFMHPVEGHRQLKQKGHGNAHPETDKSVDVEESDAKPQVYIFFDFECTQDDLLECTDGYQPGESGCKNC